MIADFMKPEFNTLHPTMLTDQRDEYGEVPAAVIKDDPRIKLFHARKAVVEKLKLFFSALCGLVYLVTYGKYINHSSLNLVSILGPNLDEFTNQTLP